MGVGVNPRIFPGSFRGGPCLGFFAGVHHDSLYRGGPGGAYQRIGCPVLRPEQGKAPAES